MPSRRRIAVVLSLALLLGACGAHRPLPRLLPPGERVPVVLVPGISGSRLDDSRGQPIWGRGMNLLWPRDHGNQLALSIVAPPGPAPARIIASMRLLGGLVAKPIYGPIGELLEQNHYGRGRAEAPSAGGDVYEFAYDWRQDNVASAQQLAALLEKIVAARGKREVDLVCQSNGAFLCRWVLKYGGLSLEQAEAGEAAHSGFEVRRMVFVGTANGGGLRILREMHRGRSYVPLVGRRIEPEVLFTMPSLFQDLPAYNPRPFIDQEGKPLPLDLYDAALWRDRSLSIFGEESKRRADLRPEIYGDDAARFAFLTRALDRAKRLHVQLGRDLPVGATRFYSIQNTYVPTPHAVVLKNGELLFTDDAKLNDDPYLKALAAAPGDGHATVESQQFLSRSEKAALAAPPYFVSGPHFELILDPGALHRLLDFLR
jgi:hypothetical protein